MLFIVCNYVQQMSFPCIHWLFILYNSALSVPVINYLHQNKLKCEIEGNNSCFNFAYTQLLKFSVHFTSCHMSELQVIIVTLQRWQVRWDVIIYFGTLILYTHLCKFPVLKSPAHVQYKHSHVFSSSCHGSFGGPCCLIHEK